MKGFLFIVGFVLLLVTELARVYLIMPFPGSQQANTIDIAYFIQSHLGLLRLLGFALIAWPLYNFFKSGSRWTRIGVGSMLAVYIVIFYFFNYRFLAEKMFYQPTNTILLPANSSKVDSRQLVLGVSINGEAKAYPIEIIGYHHQVRDIIGGEPVMVTYCTVCRTGRIFEPVVNGKPESFRLVGMDHFNAMFEDKSTRSWWRQVSGEAIAGELKGTVLPEIHSEQMSLQAWNDLHPNTLILQQDTLFRKEYAGMRNYDEGKSKGSLTRHDTLSWKDKSWVVGVPMGLYAKAYDWNDLKKQKVMNDFIEGVPVVVALQNDTTSFHVWVRITGKDTLTFTYDNAKNSIVDKNSGSVWDWSGKCTEGKYEGAHIKTIQSYQEFWHSWKTFHPQTTKYNSN